MRNAIRCSVGIGLLSLVMSTVLGPVTAFAQGRAGGSVGNDEKSLSGSREAPRSVEKPARRSKPDADEPRRESRKSGGGGGGGGNFDGAWIISAVGGNCGGSSSNPFIVSSGKIMGKNVQGTVSPNGALYGTSTGEGHTVTTTGRLSARSGGGTFRITNGCTGTWTAVKQ
jgi:hypothetical protein